MINKSFNTINLLKRLSNLDKSLFDIPVESQKHFLLSLGNPVDDIDRSFKQYLCQNFFSPWWKKAALNVIGAVSFFFLIVYYRFYHVFVLKRQTVEAVGDYKGMEEIVPDVLREKYRVDVDSWNKAKGSLSHKDLFFIFRVWRRHPFSPFFCAKILIKLAKYSSLKTMLSPSAIIVHNEYSFTSSILTSWCEENAISHIDIMHGEKLFYIRDSFFRYTRCYVWSDFYVRLLTELKADSNQFTVAVPPSMQIDIEKYYKSTEAVDYKYYLAIINKSSIQKIAKSINRIIDSGHSILIRPHPRYTDLELLRKYIDDCLIEDPSKISILESIANTSYAIGVYSTVLSQAFYSGRGVIIDDITDPAIIAQLQSMEYHLIQEETINRLSLVLKELEESIDLRYT